MFITFEGIDGTGKSTAARLLAEALNAKFVATPGEDYSAIREVAVKNKYSRYYYYLSSNYYISAMSEGTPLVCDRYIHSTIAYNWPFYGELPCEPFSFYQDLKKPDISFLLCASDEVRHSRMEMRHREGGALTALDRDLEGQRRAQRIYEQFADLVQISTEGKTIRDVLDELLAYTQKKLSL